MRFVTRLSFLAFVLVVLFTTFSKAQTPCSNQFPGAINSQSTLCDAGDNSLTQLSASINASVTVITVSDTTKFSATGIIVIDTEQMIYTSKTLTTFTVTRGSNGTAAQSHSIGTQVKGPWTKTHVLAQSNAQMAIEVKTGNTPVGEQNAPVNDYIMAGRPVAGTSSWRTKAQLGLVGEASLTTGNIPEWDGSQLVDSPILDNGSFVVVTRRFSFGGSYPIRWDSTNIAAPSTSNIDTGARVIYYAGTAPDQYTAGLESGYKWETSGGGYKWYFNAGNNGVTTLTNAGLAINNANLNAASALQVDSTTRGFLPPRMTTTQRNAISSPPEGLTVYNLTDHVPNFYNSGSWIPFGTISGSGSANAYAMFNGTSTIQNGYWKQGTNVLAMDGAGFNPEIELFTNGTLGQTNVTYGAFNATSSAVTITAGRAGSFSSQVTGINLNSIGSTSVTNIQRDGSTHWTFELSSGYEVLSSPNALNTLGKSTAPIGRLNILYNGGIVFYNSNVAQLGLYVNSADTLTLSPAVGAARIEFASNTYITSGAGSPEGSVTASPGSIYSRTSDGHIWRKDTLTGNTGWVDMSAGGSIPQIAVVSSNTRVIAAGTLTNDIEFSDTAGNVRGGIRTDSAEFYAVGGYTVGARGTTSNAFNANGIDLYGTQYIRWRTGNFGTIDSVISRASASVFSFTDGSTGGAALQLFPKSATPASPASSAEANFYVKGNKFVIQYNDAGTVRYKYLDLTSTTVTWTATTSAP